MLPAKPPFTSSEQIDPGRLAKRGKTLALETPRDNMKNYVAFINTDIHASMGGKMANLNEKIKEIIIYFEIFGRGFS